MKVGVINSVSVLNNSCSGSLLSASGYEVWLKAGVGVWRQQNGQEEKDSAISSVFSGGGRCGLVMARGWMMTTFGR